MFEHVITLHGVKFTIVVEEDVLWGWQVKHCIVDNGKTKWTLSEKKFIASFSDGQDVINNALEAAASHEL